MIHLVIAEDQEKDRELLLGYLSKFTEETGQRFQITCFADGVSLVEDYPGDCEILLLDIEMKGMNGMEAARILRRRDPHVIILFITNMVQFSLDGYSVNAQNFLIKPVDWTVFSAELTKAAEKLARKRPQLLQVKGKDGVFLINMEEITYVETFRHRVILHTRDGQDIECGETMAEMERRLQNAPFFRCHEAYLINLEYVERFQRTDVWVCKKQIPVSRHRKKEFLEALSEFMGDWL